MAEYSPMMQHYLDTKKDYKDKYIINTTYIQNILDIIFNNILDKTSA